MWDGEIVRSPRMVHAHVEGTGHEKVLTVYRSVLVRVDGRLYAPIAGLLGETCTSILSADEVDDKEMMHGRAIEVVRKIWPACPGADQPHRCRTTADIDQEVRALCEKKEESAA